MTLCDDIRDLTSRALWEMENLLAAIPPELWDRRYDGLPMWKYVYHTLYSMDRWFINPQDPDYQDPPPHRKDLADLNAVPPAGETLSRQSTEAYFHTVSRKLLDYVETLSDETLSCCPPGCQLSRLKLILGQFRHWHRHMGIIYGFLIQDTGKWPLVLNMFGEVPPGKMPHYYP